MKIKRINNLIILLTVFSLILISIPFSPIGAQSGVPLKVDAPATVTEESTFNLYINIGDEIQGVTSLATWSFNLTYDSDVVRPNPAINNGSAVTKGYVGGKEAPVYNWGASGQPNGTPLTGDKIIIIGNVKNIMTGHLDGTGYLAVVNMLAVGDPGESCTISIEGPPSLVLSDTTGRTNSIPSGTITSAQVTIAERDDTPPAKPAGLSAVAGNGQVLLNWTANPLEDGVQKYKIYKSTNGGAFDAGLEVGNVTNYNVTGLTTGIPYTFAISATDASNNESIWSDTATATPTTNSGIPVSLSGPVSAAENGKFDVYVNIGQVEDLVTWTFDLVYNDQVVQIPDPQNGNGVTEGRVGDIILPVYWNSFPVGAWGAPVTGNTIRVAGFMDLPDVVYGNGEDPSYLAVVHFNVIGAPDTSSVIHIENVALNNSLIEPITSIIGNDILVTITPDVTPPSVLAVNPAHDTLGVPTNTTLTAIFSEAVNGISADTFTLSYESTSASEVGGLETEDVVGTVAYDAATRTASFDPDALLPFTTYTAVLHDDIADLATAPNNLAEDYTWSFTTGSGEDNDPPFIAAVNPEDGAEGVPTNTALKVLFSEVMNAYTINPGTFILRDGDIEVQGVINYNSVTNMATLAPSEDMLPETEYTAEIAGTVSDIAGNALTGGTFTWTFTTGLEPDIEAPEIVTVNPPDGATDIGTNVQVSAQFSEPIFSATLNAGSFTLEANGEPVSGTIFYDSATRYGTFTPLTDLDAGTVYTAAITTEVLDVAGNPLAADYVWSFTTGIGEDLTPPMVSGLYWGGTPDGAYINTSVAAIFSEAMNPATINTDTFRMLLNGVTPVAGIVEYAGVTAVFTPTENLPPFSNFVIEINTGVADLAGNNMLEDFNYPLVTLGTMNLISPIISSTNPANGETNVGINKSITATFSKAMNPLTITPSTFTLKKSGSPTNVPGAVTAWGANAMFNPTADMDWDTEYTATISEEVRDLNGRSMLVPYSWTFTTSSAPDETAPKVSSTNPANGATNVPRDRSITATFTEPVDVLTITPYTFTLSKVSDNTTVSGLLTYSDTTATFTFVAISGILDENTQYQGTITTGIKDLAGNAMEDNYTWRFTTGTDVDNTRPEVSATSPANNEVGVAVDRAITATFTEAMNDTTITTANFTLQETLNNLDNLTVPGTVNYYGMAAVFTPLSDLNYETQYTAWISNMVTDLAGNRMQDNYTWTFTTGTEEEKDLLPPTVSFTDPENGEIDVSVNRAVSATFSEPIRESTITSATFTLEAEGGFVEGAVYYNGTTAMFTPLNILDNDTLYTATITTEIADLAGNTMDEPFTWSFTTGAMPDDIAPQVSSTHPVNGAVDVPLNDAITASFNEAMDTTTITTNSFTLEKTTGGDRIPGTVAYSITTATYWFIANLDNNTEYTARITTDVKDLAGNPMAEPYSWSFTTGNVLDTIAPTVSEVVPLHGATGVDLNTSISATFSEPMDVETITNQHFTLSRGSTDVPGTVYLVNNTATFVPDEDMLPETTYKANISTDVRDLAKLHMEEPYTWSFKTGEAPDITPPMVESTDPADGEADVTINRAVTAIFSEVMDQLTITSTNFILAHTDNGTLVTGSITYSGISATFNPSEFLDPNEQYTATITTGVQDLAGLNMEDNYSWSFTTSANTDLVGPEVETMVPADGATGISVSTKVTAEFSEAMLASSVNTGSFTLQKTGDDNLIDTTVTYNPSTKVATLTPSAKLATKTNYTATVTTEVEDLAGNRMENERSWSFTTVSGGGTSGSSGGGGGGGSSAPVVSSTSIADKSTNVDVKAGIKAKFSMAMNLKTINTTTFLLMNGTTPVTGSVDYGVDNFTATFTPSSPLDYSVLYTATITTGAKNSSNRAIARNFVWTFTTMAKPEPTTTPISTPTSTPISTPTKTPTSTPTATVSPTPTPPQTETPTPTPTPKTNWGLIIGLIIAAIVVILVVILIIRRNRKKLH